MADLDTLLRDSFERLAEHGDPSGVARAIQARVDAGGGPGPSTGPGGGILGGFRSWIPWVGLALVAGVAGGAAGLGGAFGVPPTPVPGIRGTTDGGVQAFACPGGSAVQRLQPGERVLAVERSDDKAWLAVRDPYALTRIVWLPAGIVVVDSGQPAVDTLAIGACPPAPSLDPLPVVTEAPAPAPAPAPGPHPKPTKSSPPPAPDTTPPSISASGWSPGTIVGTNGPHTGLACTPDDYAATLTVTASDNVGVTSVSASSNFGASTVTQTGHSGSSYTYKIVANYDNGSSHTSVTVTFTAHDSAGNTASVAKTVTVNSSGTCLG